jgi:hypothetical protein
VGSTFDRGDCAEVFDSALAGRVGGSAREGSRDGDGGDVHDAARSSLAHRWQGGSHTSDGAEEVGVDIWRQSAIGVSSTEQKLVTAALFTRTSSGPVALNAAESERSSVTSSPAIASGLRARWRQPATLRRRVGGAQRRDDVPAVAGKGERRGEPDPLRAARHQRPAPPRQPAGTVTGGRPMTRAIRTGPLHHRHGNDGPQRSPRRADSQVAELRSRFVSVRLPEPSFGSPGWWALGSMSVGGQRLDDNRRVRRRQARRAVSGHTGARARSHILTGIIRCPSSRSDRDDPRSRALPSLTASVMRQQRARHMNGGLGRCVHRRVQRLG